MPEHLDLVRFYERSYSPSAPGADAWAGRWRSLSAIPKADHVIALCERGGISPQTILDVGCGDGALLSEMHSRGFGGHLEGVEIAETAIGLAAGRPGIDAVRLYDGTHLPSDEHSFELGIVAHVLEHVPEPTSLLREVSRVCRSVVIEVPLEANLSALRPSRRDDSQGVGHLHRLSREDIRALVDRAGLRISGEIEDPLPLSVHRFFASGPLATAGAIGKWAVRTLLHRLAPPLARRLFTVHYACLCTKDSA